MTPRPLTDAERAELRELLAKATPAPWEAREVWKEGGYTIDPLVLEDGEIGYGLLSQEDAEAIAWLRNYADRLLAAAAEIARLKAGVADRDHTTHFDDCGCRSARYEAEIARLKAKLAAVREHAATFDNADGESAFLSIVDCPYNEPLHHHHDGCPECTEHAPPTTFRDDAATTPEGHEA